MPLPDRLTILIVDQEPSNLELARGLFENDYQVLSSTDPQEGVRFLTSREVHIVITDTGIPELLQKEFFETMKGDYSEEVPVIFSGEADLELMLAAINQEYMFRYITKPWNLGELREVVRQAQRHMRQIAEADDLMKELESVNRALKEQNEQLRELDKLKTAFMAVASHELRTPVTLISGFASLLDVNPTQLDEEKLKSTTARIQEGAKRLERIIHSMLQMLESESDMSPLDLSLCNPGEILRNAVKDAMPFVEMRKQTVSVNIEELPDIKVDEIKINDVLDNLLLNAVKFSPDGAEIEATASRGRQPGTVEFQVRDHGVGIASEDLPFIYDPMFSTFDTLHHSSGVYEFQRRGIGLGLSLCKRFVEMHGGQIFVESEVNVGSRFTIRLHETPPVKNHKPAEAER